MSLLRSNYKLQGAGLSGALKPLAWFTVVAFGLVLNGSARADDTADSATEKAADSAPKDATTTDDDSDPESDDAKSTAKSKAAAKSKSSAKTSKSKSQSGSRTMRSAQGRYSRSGGNGQASAGGGASGGTSVGGGGGAAAAAAGASANGTARTPYGAGAGSSSAPAAANLAVSLSTANASAGAAAGGGGGSGGAAAAASASSQAAAGGSGPARDDPNCRKDAGGGGGGGTSNTAQRKNASRRNQADTPTTFNAAIVAFGIENVGKQVGNGECWTLGAEALKAAGARRPNGYVFGNEIPLDHAVPGDIIQFESARFVGPNYWIQMGVPNHTAILYVVNGTKMLLLNQNVNGSRLVQFSMVDMAELQTGTVTVYRAVEKTEAPDLNTLNFLNR